MIPDFFLVRATQAVPQVKRCFAPRDNGVFGLAVEPVRGRRNADFLDNLRCQIVVLVTRFDAFAPAGLGRISGLRNMQRAARDHDVAGTQIEAFGSEVIVTVRPVKAAR